MKEYSTLFPTKIDAKIYFSDMDLKYSETLNEYQGHIANSEYQLASECLQDSDVDNYGSYIVNLLNRRCNAIGTFLMNKPNKEQNTYYQAEEPISKNGIAWISD